MNMEQKILEQVKDEEGNLNVCMATFVLAKVMLAINIGTFGDLEQAMEHVNEHFDDAVEFYEYGGVEQ